MGKIPLLRSQFLEAQSRGRGQRTEAGSRGTNGNPLFNFILILTEE